MTTLKRTVSTPGAVLLGLGSILGTGVFVSLAVVAGVASVWLPLSVLLGGLVAALNGLSSAQLASVHPVAGGTYAYGRRFLNPTAGFVAGWFFLVAKSASAATAALGVVGYTAHLFGLSGVPRMAVGVLAAAVVALIAWWVDRGLKRSNTANAVLVTVTLLALVVFALNALGGTAMPTGALGDLAALDGASAAFDVRGVLFGAALSFVAFTGYGRVATLGEEVKNPRRTIPVAVVFTLAVVLTVYLAVAFAGLSIFGWDAAPFAALAWSVSLDGAAAPLADLLLLAGAAPAWAVWVVSLGAVTAMLGVLLNLLLGLSRVAFAMGRDGELPTTLGRLDARGVTPRRAVWAVAALVGLIALWGDVRLAWTFSAVNVLIYYALTNLSALQVVDGRFVPKAVSVLGLVGCLSLAAFVPWPTWLLAGGFLTAGLLARAAVRSGR